MITKNLCFSIFTETTIVEAFMANSYKMQDDCQVSIDADSGDVPTIIEQEIHLPDISLNPVVFSFSVSIAVTYLNDNTNSTPTSTSNEPRFIQAELSDYLRLPDKILTLFPDLCEQEVVDNLIKVQDETDKIYGEIDKKYEKCVMTSTISSLIYIEFNTRLESYLYNTFPTQVNEIKEALSILGSSSFGLCICNTKKQVLAVANHYGSWSAMKGHPKIKADGTLENPWETALRELFEELSVQYKTSKRVITIDENKIGYFNANKVNFFQCHLDSRRGANDRSRLIGLFYIQIDEKKWKFSLKDNKENKACEWLNIKDIINNNPQKGKDIYYTLRPCVQYLKDNNILD